MATIYFDHNATTPVALEVLEAMIPCFFERHGNPSSLHHRGIQAERAIKAARRTIAQHLCVDDREILFTSGGTESVNLAIKGIARALHRQGKHIITARTEHEAVLESIKQLVQEGFEVSYVNTDEFGQVTPEAVVAAVRPNTILVAIMHVNNELGTINPIEHIAKAVKLVNKDIMIFSDGAQAFGKLKVSLQPIDAYSISGHKFHAPQGVGALFLKKGTLCKPLISGGGQELGMRSGTENVPAIVGLAEAAKMAYAVVAETRAHFKMLQNRLIEGLQREGVVINSPEDSLENTVNVSFLGIPSEVMMNSLDEKGVCVSAGSACAGRKRSPSHVLKAIGLSEQRSRSAIRFSFSRYNTMDEVDFAVRAINTILLNLTAVIR